MPYAALIFLVLALIMGFGYLYEDVSKNASARSKVAGSAITTLFAVLALCAVLYLWVEVGR